MSFFEGAANFVGQASPIVIAYMLIKRFGSKIDLIADRVEHIEKDGDKIKIDTKTNIENLTDKINSMNSNSKVESVADSAPMPPGMGNKTPREIICLRWDDVWRLIEKYSYMLFPQQHKFADGPMCAISRLRNHGHLSEEEFQALFEMRNYRFKADNSSDDEFFSMNVAERFSKFAEIFIISINKKINTLKEANPEADMQYREMIKKFGPTMNDQKGSYIQ